MKLVKMLILSFGIMGVMPAPKAQASIYSLASKTMELVDPDGRNMVKFVLSAGTATVLYYGIDAVDRHAARFCRKYNVKNVSKYCSAAILAYSFWNAVLPKGKK